MGSIYLTEVDPQKAMRSKGAFGQKWREAKLKATRALDQQTDLASFSSYRPEVVKYLSMVWLQKGSVLWAEGDISDDCFYYVVAGFCDVIQGQDEQQHVVRRLGAGATFGDVAVRAEFEATRGESHDYCCQVAFLSTLQQQSCGQATKSRCRCCGC